MTKRSPLSLVLALTFAGSLALAASPPADAQVFVSAAFGTAPACGWSACPLAIGAAFDEPAYYAPYPAFYAATPAYYASNYTPAYYAPTYAAAYAAPAYYTPSYYSTAYYAPSYYAPSYYAPSYYAPPVYGAHWAMLAPAASRSASGSVRSG